MSWNWELEKWPQFVYDLSSIREQEKQFLLNVGDSLASLKHIEINERNQVIVEILSREGLNSSKIEGELLDRESLQSSIKKHFGIQGEIKRGHKKESAMANLLCSMYDSFNKPLTEHALFQWHAILFEGSSQGLECGKYRSHEEPMQIVSSRYTDPRVFFEAPPSNRIAKEMKQFIQWFNAPYQQSILGRAAVSHVYFESIHPFEDGNGRLGRLLAEKVLSQGVGRPVLIAISAVLEARKKEYYAALERCNRTLEIQHWIEFFADIILEAQKESSTLLYFLVKKAKLLNRLVTKLNDRQEKVLLRIFAEGPKGFQGGLSAENYIAITKTSRATATRDLADLVQKGALMRTGELKNARYWLNFDL